MAAGPGSARGREATEPCAKRRREKLAGRSPSRRKQARAAARAPWAEGRRHAILAPGC